MTLSSSTGALPERRPHLLSLWTDLTDRQTWRTGLYLLLSLPMSAAVTSVLVAGLLSGALSLPLLVGFIILPLTLLALLWLNAAQRGLAGLLGLHFGPPVQTPKGGPLDWIRFQVRQPALWRGAVFQLVALPLSLLSWAVMGAALGLTLGAFVGAIWPLLGLTLTLGQQVVTLSLLAQLALGIAGLGGLVMSAALVGLLGRVWAALAGALLRPEDPLTQAQRAVQALGQAAGQVALGENLHATLQRITEQAWSGSSALGVRLEGPGGSKAAAGPSGAVPESLPLVTAPQVQALAGPGEGPVLASLPVRVAGLPWGTLHATFPALQPPDSGALTLLSGMANHAGTAVHAAQLAERAAGRAEEEARARLARELHDSVAQALYGISLGAKTARATLDTHPEQARASLDYTIGLAEGGVSEMKALLFSLRPDALAEGGLLAALEQQAHVLRTRHELSVQTHWNEEPPLSPAAQTAAYRIALEALHNVVKHAHAQHVRIELAQAGRQLQMTVQDDGRGFDQRSVSGGTLGQRSMRERAAEVGGRLEVRSAPGQGTVVQLWLELESEPSSPPSARSSALHSSAAQEVSQ
ncbi:histidine kinase [Deinococcus piscis]|uniref:Histidine kinase n=1 Tax=Deinococcus piscis TaxID=394230 RepID=A0ABQ3K837_9DEIO|nr:sensor domain-containing protein [Deinococcus piscis]GHG06099.1 histidine kinase [Deinococcus piscis]